ncbi:MAG TPA: glutamate racemase [Bacteroidales bacterium]|nr:glutamate racemase [Bacteroidales bacterium]
METSQPIGLFDSGIGGLTVAGAIKTLLPNERMIYFGDTAHLPYGDKSADAIRAYSKRIAEFLLEKNCKVIMIACNTASAAAYDIVRDYVGNRALVMNVIDPTVDLVCDSENSRNVGVIGTKGTVNSGTYSKKILERRPDYKVSPLATPLLVPMIEEGFIFDDISNAIIRAYLSNDAMKDIDSLILGCTHYPIIKNQIRKYFNFNIKVIDSSLAAANCLKDTLIEKNMLAHKQTGKHEFYVSDYTEMFEKIGEMFFEEPVKLQLANLWE